MKPRKRKRGSRYPPLCYRTVEVANLSQLQTALANILPGDCINLAAGTYTFPTNSTMNLGGTAQRRVTISGAGPATIIQGNTAGAGGKPNNAFILGTGADYITFRNLRFNRWFYGPYINPNVGDAGGQYLIWDGVEFDHNEQQGLAIQRGSTHGLVTRCSIHDMGLALNGTSGPGQFGEGIYLGGIGADCSNWVIEDSDFYNITAEQIDISGSLTLVRRCTFDGQGSYYIQNVQAGLIGVSSNNVEVYDCVASYGMPHFIVCYVPGTTGFKARRNTAHLFDRWNLAAYCVAASNTATDRVVGCDNVADNLPVPEGGGVTDVTCTPP